MMCGFLKSIALVGVISLFVVANNATAEVHGYVPTAPASEAAPAGSAVDPCTNERSAERSVGGLVVNPPAPAPTPAPAPIPAPKAPEQKKGPCEEVCTAAQKKVSDEKMECTVTLAWDDMLDTMTESGFSECHILIKICQKARIKMNETPDSMDKKICRPISE